MQNTLLAQLCKLQPQQKISPFFTKKYYTSLKVPEASASFHIARVWNLKNNLYENALVIKYKIFLGPIILLK